MLKEAFDAGAPEAVIDDHLAAIEQSHDHIKSIVQTSLSGGRVTTVTITDVGASAWQVVDTQDLDLEVTDANSTVEGNPPQLRRLFANLYRNVREHADDATIVAVRSTDRGFSIEDDGEGFAGVGKPRRSTTPPCSTRSIPVVACTCESARRRARLVARHP